MLLAAAASPLLGHPGWGPKLVPQLCQTIADAGTSARHVRRAPSASLQMHMQIAAMTIIPHESTRCKVPFKVIRPRMHL